MTMTRWKPIIVLATLALAGCSDMMPAAVAQRGAVVADKALENAEWLLCKAATVGSVVRRYGVSTEKADAWRVICRSDPMAEVIRPAE